MAKIKKISPIIIYGVPILIGAYLIYKSIKPTDKTKKTKVSDTETNNNGGLTPAVAKLFPLKRGSKGEKVEELQKAILIYDKNLLPKFGADKDYGSETENAVKTILGKSIIDSQDDIDKIIKLANDKNKNAETAAKNKTLQANRTALANSLVSHIKKNKGLDFFAIHDVAVGVSSITSDGRLYGTTTKVYKKGEMIEAANAVLKVTPDGLINLERSSKVYIFSPYGFEVK
jgi:hypothetical protein